MAADYCEDDCLGLSSLIFGDDITNILMDEVIRDAKGGIRESVIDAADRMDGECAREYTVRIRATAKVHALTEEAALTAARMLLKEGGLRIDDSELD